MYPDIVYIYSHKHSKWRGQELKFSLRSLEVFGRNYGKVIIVGDKPSYLNNKVIHIPKEDETGFKEVKIFNKLILAAKSDQVSDPFVFFNDDFFLIRNIDFPNLEYYYFDNLRNKVNKREADDTYKRALTNTYHILIERQKPTKHFDIHYPMKYSKTRLGILDETYDWNIRAGYVIKSLYCNTFGIEGKSKKDCKVYDLRDKKEINNIIAQTDLFSTENITRATAETLNKLFVNKSSYEI